MTGECTLENTVKKKRGKLKIFLGMAPGVGKTYTMLSAAYERFRKGTSTLVGIIESDEDNETNLLMKKMPVKDLLIFKSNGLEQKELDVNGIIKDNPSLVVIDRFEHINCPGVSHRFRYQDIEEILENGISVYTTLNVHHIEGLIETVFQVTGVQCYETVPDRLFDMADEVELIDMPVDDLLEKYKSGRIKIPDYLRSTAHEFYRKSNIIALRELTLRRLAKRVNCELTDYLNTRTEEVRTPEQECVIAVIEAQEGAEEVIRAADRFASDKDVRLVGVLVRTSSNLSSMEQDRISRCIGLASELGGELVQVDEDHAVNDTLKVAKEKNASCIFVGCLYTDSGKSSSRQQTLFNDLVRKSGKISVTAIKHYIKNDKRKLHLPSFPSIKLRSSLSDIKDYLISIGTCLVVTVLCFSAGNHLDYRSVAILFLLTTSLLSLCVKRGPVMAAAILSAFIWDLLFQPSRFGLLPANFLDTMLFGFFFIVAFTDSYLISSIQKKGSSLQEQTSRSSLLSDIVKDIFQADGTDQIIRKTVKHTATAFHSDVAFYLYSGESEFKLSCHQDSTWCPMDPADDEAINYVLANRIRAGAHTQTNPEATATYYPLVSGSRVEGVIGLKKMDSGVLSLEDEMLLHMIIQQTSMALEKQRLRSMAEKSMVLAESEKLYKTLFNSLSHEFRTPLVTIIGASGDLALTATAHDETLRKTLVGDILNSAARLNRLVTNLLDMSRIESGHLKVRLEWCDVYDLLDALSESLSHEIEKHPLKIEVDDNFPLLKIDSGLIRQAFVNITENAIHHSPEGEGVTIKAFLEDNIPVIKFEDEGPGFPPEAMPHLFKKFFRVQNSTYPGIGLGLSIVKGFLEAHGAIIEVSNRTGKGAKVTVRFIHTPQGAA